MYHYLIELCLIFGLTLFFLVTIEEEIKFHNLAAEIEDYILYCIPQ